jgi:hypothetical protein
MKKCNILLKNSRNEFEYIKYVFIYVCIYVYKMEIYSETSIVIISEYQDYEGFYFDIFL